MQVFTANDIVEVAVRIEENGITFYNFAEQMAKTADVKNSSPIWRRRRRHTNASLKNFCLRSKLFLRRNVTWVNMPSI